MEVYFLKPNKTSYKDIFYYYDKQEIFNSKSYAFVKEHAKTLNKPIFTIKKSQTFINSITYRKINDWDSKNLISGSRDNAKAGWRKFSLVDIVRFYIINDLRNIGLDIEAIRNILRYISNSTADFTKNGKSYYEAFLQLEYFMLSCLNGNKIMLLIAEESGIYFFSKEDAVYTHFNTDEASSPLIILPFFSYIRTMQEKLKTIKLDSEIAEFMEDSITK